MLKLSAKILGAGFNCTAVKVRWHDKPAGVLTVDKEHADELVGLLSAATEMREALIGVAFVPLDGSAYCWCDHWVEAKGTHSVECMKARAVLAKPKGPTP
jgi:hypothetical protein